MAIATGQKAPDFTLYDSDKNKVSLADLKGKNIVLLFFPLAFTGTCTAELCNIRDNIGLYNNTNAAVMGISVDSVFVLDKYKKEQTLNFPLLSDFNKEVSQAYDVFYEVFPALEMKGVSKRAAFVVDKDGIIQYAEVCATPGHQPDYAAIQQKLSELV